MMAIAAVGNNLITYVFGEMHFQLSQSANIVTNFIGTVFLLSLLGGFLSDSYLGSFWTMLIFGFVELSVSKVSTLQRRIKKIQQKLSFGCNFHRLRQIKSLQMIYRQTSLIWYTTVLVKRVRESEREKAML
jgi:hypothetical protein